MHGLSSHRDHERRNDEVRERQRQQKLPTERHQLVIAETRHGSAHPNVNEDEDEYRSTRRYRFRRLHRRTVLVDPPLPLLERTR